MKKNKIAFVVKRSVPFSGNIRIMAEALLKCGNFQLIIYKNGPLDDACLAWHKQGVRVYDRFSIRALREVHSADTVILGHSGRDAFLKKRKAGRKIINLWHGVAIKRIEHLMPKETAWSYKSWKRRYLMRINSRIYDALIASSPTDRLTNALAFGMDLDKVHATGLPRFDYLAPDYVFPENLQNDAQTIAQQLKGRRMVLYAPTFREKGASALASVDAENLSLLLNFLKQQNIVLGIRPHPYDQKALHKICDGEWIIDLRSDIYIEPAIVLRAASVLVVDYSSIWIDYLLLKRPIIGFMPDFDAYATQERGFIFDLHEVLPGPILSGWQEVIKAIAHLQKSDFDFPAEFNEKYNLADHLFLPNQDIRFKSTEICIKKFLDTEAE